MAKVKQTKKTEDLERSPGSLNHTRAGELFTGVARSVECYSNQEFRNFRVLTLYIEEGVIKRIEVSDPYANFEALVRLDYWNYISMTNLNMNYEDKKAFIK